MPDLPAGLLDGIGIAGLLVLAFVLLSRGVLVTRREVERLEHDRDEWRAESRIKDQQIAEKDAQLRHMGEVGRQVKRVMAALQQLPHAPEVDEK